MAPLCCVYRREVYRRQTFAGRSDRTERHHEPVARSVEAHLQANPVEVSTARLPATDEGARNEAGFYAWWLTDESALPAVLTSQHPERPELGLVYVGIAPKDSLSKETIRSRILSKHLGNALGSSTLRRGLAAFLWESNGWHPFATPRGKPALPPEECVAMTRWMETNLLVSWRPAAKPWDYERALIGDMKPPLNSHHNTAHAFYRTLRETRAHMMTVARAATA